MQIVGKVSYIVRDQITVQNGVTVAPGCHVILQAGNVVEMDSVEFDGTNSSVEILEVPCPNRMAGEEGCGNGGSMLIDADAVLSYVTEGVVTDPQAASTILENGQILEEERGVDFWAYPNPCDDELTLGFSLDEDATCSLVVFDLHMRPVRKVLEGTLMEEGEHEVKIDASDVPAGFILFSWLLRGSDEYQAGEAVIFFLVSIY